MFHPYSQSSAPTFLYLVQSWWLWWLELLSLHPEQSTGWMRGEVITAGQNCDLWCHSSFPDSNTMTVTSNTSHWVTIWFNCTNNYNLYDIFSRYIIILLVFICITQGKTGFKHHGVKKTSCFKNSDHVVSSSICPHILHTPQFKFCSWGLTFWRRNYFFNFSTSCI